MRSFKNINRIKIFINDPNKKSFFTIIKELWALYLLKGEVPLYYFKYLYRKNVENYSDYLSNKEANSIVGSKKMHKPEFKLLFDNKLYFSFFSEKTEINTPKLIGYNLGKVFYYNNTPIQIDSKKALIKFFEEVFKSNNLEGLFFRPSSGYGGKDVFKLTKKNLTSEIGKRFELFFNDSFVHTEIIEQHEEINKIHSKSVSTLRIISLITPENKTEIISAFIRFGVGDSFVDNASSGGFLVGINLEDGTLKKNGYFLLEYGGAVIDRHPNSGFVFEGFSVPFFKEACEEVINAVKILPNRWIGWDVALTPNGPTIVEANSSPHMLMSEQANGGLLKNQHIKNLVEELK